MSFFDDDFNKRYYSPLDERDDTEYDNDGDSGKDHYFSPLDEPDYDEEILPFSHVEFDDEDKAENSLNEEILTENSPTEEPLDDYDPTDFVPEEADSYGESDYGESDYGEPEQPEEFYNEPADETFDEPDDNYNEEPYEEPYEEPVEETQATDADDGDGVFDKRSEYLFNDEYPEEPETLGRAEYDKDTVLDESFLTSPEQVKGQISFYDYAEAPAGEGYLKKESFFEEKIKPKATGSVEPHAVAVENDDRIKAQNDVARATNEKPAAADTLNDSAVSNKEDLRSKYMFIEDENPNIAKIMVIGVGGAGNNAVNRMIEKNVNTATFVAMNTDRQALIRSKCALENRYQIGIMETKGLGAGSDPEIGERAAEESRELIEQLVDGVDLLFIAAGMGGGTGTGAAPVIAKIAKDKGCVTVAVVTKPFNIEGRKRAMNAEKGIANLKKYVDTIIIIPNDKLLEALRPDTPLVDALLFADDTLRQGICGIADIIATNALINLDFADVRTVLKDQGLAHMGIGRAKGENRVMEAVKDAVTSPLLETTIEGARGIILNVTGGKDMTIGQVYEASRQVQNIVDPSANIILGMNIDERLQEELVITLIATGFDHVNDEETDAVSAQESAQERAYKDLFAKKTVSEPAVEKVPEVEPIVEEEPAESEEEQKQPKKELPLFMRKLFKK